MTLICWFVIQWSNSLVTPLTSSFSAGNTAKSNQLLSILRCLFLQAVFPQFDGGPAELQLASECYWLGCLMALHTPPLYPHWDKDNADRGSCDVFPFGIRSDKCPEDSLTELQVQLWLSAHSFDVVAGSPWQKRKEKSTLEFGSAHKGTKHYMLFLLPPFCDSVDRLTRQKIFPLKYSYMTPN